MLKKTHPLKGLKVLVVGLGISGQSAVRFLLNRGAHVIATDRNQNLTATNEDVASLTCQGLQIVSEAVASDVTSFDMVVVSPGIPQTHPSYRHARMQGIEIIGEVELACRDITKKCLAVTGTNGKTTVTMLIEHVLQKANKKAKALGNVGIPLTSALDDVNVNDTEIYVIELSSFQIETLSHPFIDAAVLLNITPDHLDRYVSMNDYAQAKIRIKECLKPGGKLFVEERCYKDYGSLFGDANVNLYGYSAECYLYTDKQDVFLNGCKVFTLPSDYRGKPTHDVENLLAAFALCQTVGISVEQFLEALSSFKKPSHRIEFVRTVAGVHYVDDSKGTNIDAVIRAVETIEGNIILIAGGVDKGFPYTPWVDAFNGKVKSICAIGQSREKIKIDLGRHLPVALFSTMQEAVVQASSIAKPGDTVLLSPGCSSYDMFKDYAHRGQEFQRIINAL